MRSWTLLKSCLRETTETTESTLTGECQAPLSNFDEGNPGAGRQRYAAHHPFIHLPYPLQLFTLLSLYRLIYSQRGGRLSTFTPFTYHHPLHGTAFTHSSLTVFLAPITKSFIKCPILLHCTNL